MKCFKKILTCAIVATVLLSICTLNVFAEERSESETSSSNFEISFKDKEQQYDIERIISETFGDVQIESSDFLYSLDDSEDFVYADFVGGGYAIFLKNTMELLECSDAGSIDFVNSNSLKYYGGPGLYFSKVGNNFVDETTGKVFEFDEAFASEFSQNIRNTLLEKNESNNSNVKFDFSTVGKSQQEGTRGAPTIDDYLITNPIMSEGTYIKNYRYFTLNPTHGLNTSGTCGAIACQLLLGYHNYYSDRRIIENRYLNGDNGANKENNPNYCNDPMRMTSQTLGTRGSAEDGSDDANSYFAKVVSVIPSSAKFYQEKSGIQTLLNENGIDYTIDSEQGFLTSANSSTLVGEIDAGRPAIVLMQKRLGGWDHYVVAYGYQNYDYLGSTEDYLGYIVHMGHDSTKNRTWINSSWCLSYITLKINHIHDYEWEKAITTTRDEYKCSICGHRTDAAVDLDANDKYEECLFSLTEGESQYCYLVFATTGYKLIQTFGNQNTKLYVYDSEYALIVQDDNDGFGDNAYLSIYATANEPYWLKVEHLGPSYSANIKIGVTPLTSSSNSSSSITNENSYAGVQYYVSTSLNATKVYAFTPTESGTFTFKTMKYGSSYVDTYLYVVDTTSAVKCQSNDDSGGNLQASITKDLIGGRTYFIVVSTYHITNTTGQFYLDVSRQ